MKLTSIIFQPIVGLCLLAVGLLPNGLAHADCIAPPTGLVGWWQGENNSTDAITGNSAILQGGVAFVPGKVGQGFRLDGTNVGLYL